MDCVLRTAQPRASGKRAATVHGRRLELLDGALHLGIALGEGRIRAPGAGVGGVVIALELDVGRDAAMVDGGAGGRVVERGGELEGAILAERQHRLHRALAEGGAAHERRAVIILEGAGDDLGGRGGAAVHQHHDRRALQRIARRRAHFEFRFGRAALGAHDQARIEKRIRHRHGRFEHAARIVAQVEHQSLQRRADSSCASRRARRRAPARSSR